MTAVLLRVEQGEAEQEEGHERQLLRDAFELYSVSLALTLGEGRLSFSLLE